MFKKINFLLLSLFFCSNVFSSVFMINNTETIDLYPAVASEFSNPTEDTIKATCEVKLAKSVHHSILVAIVKGSGVFNGISLKEEDSRWMSFYETQTVQVIINPNTVIRLTNHGEFSIRLKCSKN